MTSSDDGGTVRDKDSDHEWNDMFYEQSQKVAELKHRVQSFMDARLSERTPVL